jgi:hypothetical protein
VRRLCRVAEAELEGIGELHKTAKQIRTEGIGICYDQFE